MTESLRVTWIAPEVGPPLGWLAELGAMVKMPGVRVRELCGEVTRGQVSTALAQRAEIVIWSGHSQWSERRNKYYLPLTRGRAVSGKWLAVQALAAAPLVFILAACGTGDYRGDAFRSLVAEVSNVGINAVGFPVKAADSAASTYIVEYVRALRVKRDVLGAHRVALDEAGWDGNGGAVRGIILRPAVTNGFRGILDRLDGFDARLTRVEGLSEAIADKLGVSFEG